MQFHQTEVSMSMTEASGALQRKPSPASSTEDLSMSTDPLIIQDIKQIPSGIQSNKSERGKITANVGQQLDEIVIQDDKGTSQPVSPQRERTYSQTYDGVFSNLSAKPEIMVLPAENARYVDDPPVPINQANQVFSNNYILPVALCRYKNGGSYVKVYDYGCRRCG